MIALNFSKLMAAIVLIASAAVASAGPETIRPGEVWPDDRGKHVQAHGGGILKQGETYYWFGEDRSKDNESTKRYVACYSSTDLVNWTFRRQVVAQTSPFPKAPEKWWTIERPKVYH